MFCCKVYSNTSYKSITQVDNSIEPVTLRVSRRHLNINNELTNDEIIIIRWTDIRLKGGIVVVIDTEDI